jgi:hypothetical protein
MRQVDDALRVADQDHLLGELGLLLDIDRRDLLGIDICARVPADRHRGDPDPRSGELRRGLGEGQRGLAGTIGERPTNDEYAQRRIQGGQVVASRRPPDSSSRRQRSRSQSAGAVSDSPSPAATAQNIARNRARSSRATPAPAPGSSTAGRLSYAGAVGMRHERPTRARPPARAACGRPQRPTGPSSSLLAHHAAAANSLDGSVVGFDPPARRRLAQATLPRAGRPCAPGRSPAG